MQKDVHDSIAVRGGVGDIYETIYEYIYIDRRHAPRVDGCQEPDTAPYILASVSTDKYMDGNAAKQHSMI